jgi:hypothetical protein
LRHFCQSFREIVQKRFGKMPKDAKKVADVPKLPHEIAAEELEIDFLKQRGRKRFCLISLTVTFSGISAKATGNHGGRAQVSEDEKPRIQSQEICGGIQTRRYLVFLFFFSRLFQT